MRIITDEEIRALGISEAQCVEWVREAFLMKQRCQLPPKISLHPQGSDFINTMPCLLPDEYHRFGCKVVSRIKGAEPALRSDMMLYDSATGKMLALLQCDTITALRTGAVATLAIETLRAKMARVYSFIGLGVMGHSVLRCLLATNAVEGMTVRLKRYKNHAERAVEMYAGLYPQVRFEIADTMDELVEDADVIVSCITVAEDLLVDDVAKFKPGVLIVPVHTRGFQNCDTVFDKVVADDEGHVNNFRYFNSFRKFIELGDVVAGRAAGRESESDRILAYNIGLGLHDVLYATRIYSMIEHG